MISLIWAQARNGVIGKDGGMPWHIREDFAHFKTMTTGGTVIMGRRTWDSLPPQSKPLPGRRNIVITNSADIGDFSGALSLPSLREAVRMAPDAWVMGGGQVYRDAIDLAERLVVTEIDARIDGDCYAPIINPKLWRVAELTEWRDTSAGLRIRVVTHLRNSPAERSPSQTTATPQSRGI